jgi:hypothetical protein
MSEIEAAAERLNKTDDSNLFYWRSDDPNRDAATVAKWALPLLDATPIAEDWLRSVGFKPDEQDGYLEIESEDSDGSLLLQALPWGEYRLVKLGESIDIAAPKTRGQLRLLAKALGITLRE